MNIGDDGLVKSIGRPWTCSICGEKTDKVDYDYLVGWDHLSCRLKSEMSDEKDKCVICGKESPYTKSTHIDMRIGYVEGGGQGCFQPNQCDKVWLKPLTMNWFLWVVPQLYLIRSGI